MFENLRSGLREGACNQRGEVHGDTDRHVADEETSPNFAGTLQHGQTLGPAGGPRIPTDWAGGSQVVEALTRAVIIGENKLRGTQIGSQRQGKKQSR